MQTKRWKPKYNETYYSIRLDNIGGFYIISTNCWVNTFFDKRAYRLHNVFPNLKEANGMIKKIKKLMKEGN